MNLICAEGIGSDYLDRASIDLHTANAKNLLFKTKTMSTLKRTYSRNIALHFSNQSYADKFSIFIRGKTTDNNPHSLASLVNSFFEIVEKLLIRNLLDSIEYSGENLLMIHFNLVKKNLNTAFLKASNEETSPSVFFREEFGKVTSIFLRNSESVAIKLLNSIEDFPKPKKACYELDALAKNMTSVLLHWFKVSPHFSEEEGAKRFLEFNKKKLTADYNLIFKYIKMSKLRLSLAVAKATKEAQMFISSTGKTLPLSMAKKLLALEVANARWLDLDTSEQNIVRLYGDKRLRSSTISPISSAILIARYVNSEYRERRIVSVSVAVSSMDKKQLADFITTGSNLNMKDIIKNRVIPAFLPLIKKKEYLSNLRTVSSKNLPRKIKELLLNINFLAMYSTDLFTKDEQQTWYKNQCSLVLTLYQLGIGVKVLNAAFLNLFSLKGGVEVIFSSDGVKKSILLDNTKLKALVLDLSYISETLRYCAQTPISLFEKKGICTLLRIITGYQTDKKSRARINFFLGLILKKGKTHILEEIGTSKAHCEEDIFRIVYTYKETRARLNALNFTCSEDEIWSIIASGRVDEIITDAIKNTQKRSPEALITYNFEKFKIGIYPRTSLFGLLQKHLRREAYCPAHPYKPSSLILCVYNDRYGLMLSADITATSEKNRGFSSLKVGKLIGQVKEDRNCQKEVAHAIPEIIREFAKKNKILHIETDELRFNHQKHHRSL